MSITGGTTAITDRRELAHRESDGIQVTLLWSKLAGDVTIEVFDARLGEGFEFRIDPRDALDGFRHPYAYAPVPGAAAVDTWSWLR